MKAKAIGIMRSAEEELARLTARRQIENSGWHSEAVLSHLVQAYRTLHRLPDHARHRAIKSVWPDDIYAKEPDLLETERFAAEVHAIALGEDEMQERQAEKNRTVVAPTPVEISRMTEALIWPARHIGERHLRVTVMNCAVIRASDRSLQSMCRKYGWPYTTTYARCVRAGKVIAKALNEEGVAVW